MRDNTQNKKNRVSRIVEKKTDVLISKKKGGERPKRMLLGQKREKR